ncbi:hypothetical protein TcarDRAFT_1290 [Thermosinus carboxydivorans Nor1]|uniref:Uncharacterized protein n=1 Tax=Thermosinus carboxydivorans Nor1 TaxID=401526 RepID=A1HR58_9FIRM|nr:hypothetical protein [Thermosinus carboxydivorans]EAX47555.1 hypothetical protein TcarDRAFT_1290 [Thermosinus carboxydivorans Nor1]
MDEMISDFLRRSRSRYTPEHIKQSLRDNLSIVTEDGFICFNIVQDECYILFCYVRPGKDVTPFKLAVEAYAKAHGCRWIKFLTHREKAFARKFKDYHPTARLFEKELR